MSTQTIHLTDGYDISTGGRRFHTVKIRFPVEIPVVAPPSLAGEFSDHWAHRRQIFGHEGRTFGRVRLHEDGETSFKGGLFLPTIGAFDFAKDGLGLFPSRPGARPLYETQPFYGRIHDWGDPALADYDLADLAVYFDRLRKNAPRIAIASHGALYLRERMPVWFAEAGETSVKLQMGGRAPWNVPAAMTFGIDRVDEAVRVAEFVENRAVEARGMVHHLDPAFIENEDIRLGRALAGEAVDRSRPAIPHMEADLVRRWRELVSIADDEDIEQCSGPDILARATGFIDDVLASGGDWHLRSSLEKHRILTRGRFATLAPDMAPPGP